MKFFTFMCGRCKEVVVDEIDNKMPGIFAFTSHVLAEMALSDELVALQKKGSFIQHVCGGSAVIGEVELTVI